jgi:hypothetical protein
LGEELDARDAERGLSPASPVLQAAGQLAIQSAPKDGIATLRIVLDASGKAESVTLSGGVVDRHQWERFAKRLLERLERHPVRLPRTTRGLVAAVRIERGDFAKPPKRRHRLERGAAVGDEPAHPGVPTNESTLRSLDKGRIRPTFGVSAASTPTRVVLEWFSAR